MPPEDIRAQGWCQTPPTRIAGPDEAVTLIERAGIATLFPVSPEFADLYAAFVGPGVPTDSGHATPSGEVYAWRWELGRREVAFYGTLVRGKPTWVAWDLLPAVLRLLGDLRPLAEQVGAGLLSDDARRVAEALTGNGGALTTGDLRRLAGFETGRERRAAYLRAIAELDRRLLVGRGFGPPDEPDDHDMRQVLIATQHPDMVAAADDLDTDAALRQLQTRYLDAAAFIRPAVFARHLRLERDDVDRSVAALAAEGLVERQRPIGDRHDNYLRTTVADPGDKGDSR